MVDDARKMLVQVPLNHQTLTDKERSCLVAARRSVKAALAQSYRCTEARLLNRTIDDAWSHFMELEINAGDVMRRGSLGPTPLTLVYVPPGEFTMGSSANEPGHSDNEGPQHKVTISKPFYMGVYTVTTEQWYAVMGNRHIVMAGGQPYPQTAVTWDDACEFCRKLSRQTGRNFHLPTEAQREYACRAGSKTAYFYGEDPTGSRLSEFAWTHGPRVSGKLKPNDWGLHDMLSNVPEWCSDYYADSYDTKDAADPSGPASGTKRAVRERCSIHTSPRQRLPHRSRSPIAAAPTAKAWIPKTRSAVWASASSWSRMAPATSRPPPGPPAAKPHRSPPKRRRLGVWRPARGWPRTRLRLSDGSSGTSTRTRLPPSPSGRMPTQGKNAPGHPSRS